VGDHHIIVRHNSHSSWSGERRNELPKEKGDCSDFDPRVQGATCVNGTMKLFRNSEGDNILWVAVEVDTTKILAKCDGFGCRDICCRWGIHHVGRST